MTTAGRVCIVTGASSGIGRAIAERLAGAGMNLCLVAAPRDEEDLDAVTHAISSDHSGVVAVTGDVGEEATAERTVNICIRRFGRVDMLANNAGIAPFGNALDASIAQLDSTYGSTSAACSSWRSRSRGRWPGRRAESIVCTASSDGIFGYEGQVAYNVSKAAVAQMVRTLSLDLAPYGVRINAVAPGWVRTPATSAALDDEVSWSKHRTQVALDRPAHPAEIAAVVDFLLSPDASYMTGAVVPCDGGLTAGFRTSDWDAVVCDPAPRARRVLDQREPLTSPCGRSAP